MGKCTGLGEKHKGLQEKCRKETTQKPDKTRKNIPKKGDNFRIKWIRPGKMNIITKN